MSAVPRGLAEQDINKAIGLPHNAFIDAVRPDDEFQIRERRVCATAGQSLKFAQATTE